MLNNFAQFQIARWRRIQEMDQKTFWRKVEEKWKHYLGFRTNVRRAAYVLDRFSLTLFQDQYVERSEVGPTNIAVKLIRQAQGGPFEPYSIASINKAAR